MAVQTRARSGRVQIPAGYGAFRISHEGTPNYAVGRKLGEGGQGQVFAAYSLLTRKVCAIKLFRHGRDVPDDINSSAAAAFESDDYPDILEDPNIDLRLSGSEREVDVMSTLENKTVEEFRESDGQFSPPKKQHTGFRAWLPRWQPRSAPLVHTHLIRMHRIIDRVRIGDSWCTLIELELAENGDLAKFLPPLSSIPATLRHRIARHYGRQLVTVLGQLHAHGVFHQDLKLSNILLDDHFTLKLGDFGLSKVEDSHANGGDIQSYSGMGTAEIKAPEVYEGDVYSREKADVWSCGVVIVMLLIGKEPWKLADELDESFRDWNAALQHSDHVAYWTDRLRSPDSSFQDDVAIPASLVSRMLQIDPGERPPMSEVRGHAWFSSADPDEDVAIQQVMRTLQRIRRRGSENPSAFPSASTSPSTIPMPPPVNPLLAEGRQISEQLSQLAERKFEFPVSRSQARRALDKTSQDQNRALAYLGRELLAGGLQNVTWGEDFEAGRRT